LEKIDGRTLWYSPLISYQTGDLGNVYVLDGFIRNWVSVDRMPINLEGNVHSIRVRPRLKLDFAVRPTEGDIKVF